VSAVDVIVIGAGVVGAACALRLAEAGLRVHVLESRCVAGGATAAGMGHICTIDDSPAQFELSRASQLEWAELAPLLPARAEYSRCGTIWLATDADELAEVDRKIASHAALGVPAERLSPVELRDHEPAVRADLAGALLVPEDAIVYAPVATRWMLDRAASLGAVIETHRAARSCARGIVLTHDGASLSAHRIVCAAGMDSTALIPGLPLRARKGHLIITERAPIPCRHQLVELAYIKNAHGHSDESVSFNVQPRPSGQLLIGSSRQYNAPNADVEPHIIRALIERAMNYLPNLSSLRALRCWTGFRAATPDSLPIIGPHPRDPSLILATGHEGLGLTTSLGTARIVASLIASTPTPVSAAPFLPSRFPELAP